MGRPRGSAGCDSASCFSSDFVSFLFESLRGGIFEVSDGGPFSLSFSDFALFSESLPCVIRGFSTAVWFYHHPRIPSPPFPGSFAMWYFRISRNRVRFVAIAEYLLYFTGGDLPAGFTDCILPSLRSSVGALSFAFGCSVSAFYAPAFLIGIAHSFSVA